MITYQGKTTSPTFIAAIHMNAESTGTLGGLTTWDDFSNGNSSARSYIPTGLTNGTNAVMVVDGATTPYTELDNAIYNCTGANGTNAAATRVAINDRANWTKQNTTVFTIPPVCAALGINDYDLESKILIYPNPSNAFFNINLLDFTQADITIFDLNGRKLKFQKIESNKSKIDISSFAKGVYLLQINTDKGSLTKQIIKE